MFYFCVKVAWFPTIKNVCYNCVMDDIIIKEGVHFIGNLCKKCGNSIRYVRGNKCAFCIKDYNKQRHQNIRDTHKTKGVFFEGDPCVSCNNCVRYVSNGICVLCQKMRGKQWIENNSDYQKQRRQIIKENNKSNGIHFEGCACVKCGGSVRYVNSGECVLCNKERKKQWHINNPEKIKANNHKRRALKKNSKGIFTSQEWIDLCNQYGNKCIVPGCERTDLHVDHVIPLTKGGTNSIDNIQPLCGSHNCSKHTKIIDYRTNPSQ